MVTEKRLKPNDHFKVKVMKKEKKPILSIHAGFAGTVPWNKRFHLDQLSTLLIITVLFLLPLEFALTDFFVCFHRSTLTRVILR